MDKPVLPMSILMLAITVHQFNARKNPDWSGVNPTSCRSAIVRLKRQAPKEWVIECKQNTMHITMHDQLKDSKGKILTNIKDIKKFIYNRLANYIVFISKNSFVESLKNVEMITIWIKTPSLEVVSYVRGSSLATMSEITSQKELAARFKEWIKTREIIPPTGKRSST